MFSTQSQWSEKAYKGQCLKHLQCPNQIIKMLVCSLFSMDSNSVPSLQQCMFSLRIIQDGQSWSFPASLTLHCAGSTSTITSYQPPLYFPPWDIEKG